MKPLEKIYIEITNGCNLSCPFCPPHSRPKEQMSPANFETILEKIRGKAEILYFHVKGEPLLHPDLGDFIESAGRAGFTVHLTTNGTLLAGKLESLRGKTKLGRLNISLHSLGQFGEGEQERLIREILGAADLLSTENRKINPRFLVSLRLWTKDDIEGTRACTRQIEEFFALDAGSVETGLRGKNGVVIREGMTVHAGETFEWPSPDGTDFGGAGFCRALRDQAGILADGTVIPCCLDGDGHLALGNILEDGAAWDDILGGVRARSLYDSFTNRNITEVLCRRCGYRTRFTKT